MDGKKISSCSLSSGFTDEKRTPCGRHLESSEIVNADASPTTSPIEEEELRARSVAASPLPYVTDVSQPELLSVDDSSSQPNAEKGDDVNLDELLNRISDYLEFMETSKTAHELKAARDEWPSNLIGLESPCNLELHARSGMKASVRGFVKGMLSSDCATMCPLLVANLRDRFEPVYRKECISLLQEIEMVGRDINTMRQRIALTETFKDLKKEAIEVFVQAALFCCSLLQSTILSRWFSKSTDKRRLRDFRDKLLNVSRKLQIEMNRQLIVEMIPAIESQFPEYAVGPAEEVIAQDSGIQTKTDTIVKENEVGRCDNQESENAQEMKRSIISAYNKLEQKLKESLHDIHSFFNGWDWSEVANIVGNSELEALETKSLVIKDANTVRVHDAIKSNCRQDTDGTVLTSASQIQALLEKKENKDIQRITGIWLLHENKGSPSMTAAKLDLMCHSLRVLALGKFGKVEGKCRGVFDKMVFFQAGIPQLPFNVGRIKELRYFSFKHEDFQLQKGYSNRYVRLNSKLQYARALKMESPWGLSSEMTKTGNVLKHTELYRRERKCRCLDGLRYKRSLLNLVTLWDLKHPGDPHDRHGFFAALKDALFSLEKLTSLEDLPHRLGNLICLGREINLLKHHEQSSIYLESLAHLMSILCSLEISSCKLSHDSQDLLRDFPFLQFSLARCSSLEKLLYRFGELKSLTVLNLQNCWLLKKLPKGLGELECLVELDLSFCCSLEDFCTNFHLLRSLQILNLTYCESLKKLPEDFHLLVSLQFLSLQFCKTLEGKSMDSVTKCKKLEKLFIEGSPMLEERWEAMKKKGKESSSLVVYTKEEGTSDQDNRASQL